MSFGKRSAKRLCVWLLVLAILAPAFPGQAAEVQDQLPTEDYDYYETVASLQMENQIGRVVLAGSGLANVAINQPAPVDISGHDPANLMLEYELRVTRDDGVTGTDSLKSVVNGWTKLFDEEGTECLSYLQPVQEGVPAGQRIAGQWMRVTLSLAPLTEGVTRIGRLEVADYNDFPKQNPPVNTGITYEVRGARIVDVSRGADGTGLTEYITALKEQLKETMDAPFDAEGLPSRMTEAYAQALEAAGVVYADDNATVTQVGQALEALQGSWPCEDKSALQEVIDEPIDRTAYSEESLAVYDNALAQAQAFLDAPASYSEVENATQALRDAIDGLALAAVADIVYGNLDSNAQVTSADALIALQAATQKVQLDLAGQTAADVNGDGGVSSADALLILQAATQKIGSVVPELEASIQADPITFCNPINLNYMYSYSIDIGNYEITGSNQSREAADPAVVIFNNEYYLFASHNDGYWVSDDLADWEFIELDTEKFPQFRKFAPATCVVGDTLYVTFSEGGALMKTTNPRDPDAWVEVRANNDWVDPALYYEEGDEYVYAFTGLSPDAPIRGCRLDPVTMERVGDWVDLFNSDQENHGFEVPGNDNTNYGSRPYLEGAWLNKYNGKYYLTYAVPGTGDASYCDGCYVADDPLGPYEFCENSPIVWKASGFAVGAGHGCLFEDLNGNWWKVDTVSIMTIGWERRLAIFPATFDEDGDLFTNTTFGDYPTYIPTESEDPFNTPGPGWNLLSYDKEATASSSLKDTRFAFDESIRSWWSAETGDTGEWLQVDLGKLYPVWSVQVNFADQDIDPDVYGRDNDFHYEYLLEFSQDGQHWFTMADRRDNTKDMPHDYIEFAEEVTARYIRITNTGEIPAGGKFAISGLRVFGEGGGMAPAAASDVQVTRYAENERSASISWPAVKGAQGYMVHFGTKEGALHNHYQVIGDNFVTLNCLNKGVDYYFRVDAYNESGVTTGTTVVKAPWTQEPVHDEDPVPSVPQPVQQQEGYTVYEAEDSHFGNTQQITGEEVRVYDDTGASGNKTLHNLEHPGAFFEFTNVDGGPGGEATLLFGYMNGNAGSQSEIFVNGTSIGLQDIPGTGGWDAAHLRMIAIPLTGLTPGATNTIRFEGGHDGFNPDWIQVIYS